MFASIRRRRSLRLRGFACFVVCAAIAIFQTASAGAQNYKQIQSKETKGAASQLRAAATVAMRDAANYQAKKQSMVDYFTKVYFPQMTNYSPSSLGQLEKKSERLLSAIRNGKVPAARKELTDITFKTMHSIARGNYHPSVRYNAVLLLGALDQKVAFKSTPPVPLPNATKSLLEILENEKFGDVKVPTSLKLGALIGLERHARFGISQEDAEKLTQLALSRIAQEEPPTDTELDVHHWLKCQAARVLTRLHAKKVTPPVHDALTKMIGDEKMSLEDRCRVADMLSALSYQGAEGIDGAATVTALGNLMKQVASEEAEFAREYEETKIGRGGRGRARVRLSQIKPIYQRARLAARLRSIALGARSLANGLSDENKAQLDGLIKPLGPVMIIATDKNNVDLKVTHAVKQLETEINAIVDSWKKPDATDADKADEVDLS